MAPLPSTVWIDPRALRGVLDAYASAAGVEPCGLLVGTRVASSLRVAEALPVANVHADARHAFLLDPEAHLREARAARERGAEVLGYWHGHLTGPPAPGLEDAHGMAAFAAIPGEGERGDSLLVIVGRGSSGRPVVRAYVPGRAGIREVSLRS